MKILAVCLQIEFLRGGVEKQRVKQKERERDMNVACLAPFSQGGKMTT